MSARFPRIDAHQHFWTYSTSEYGWIDDTMGTIARDFHPPDLQPHLEANGFSGCVAVQARTTEQENEYLLGLAEQHPWILGVVGWTDLRSSSLSQKLDAAAQRKRIVGFREVLQGQPDEMFLNEEFYRGLRQLGERGYCYDILVHSTQLDAVATLVKHARADQPLVLDHLGKPDVRGGGFAAWSTRIRTLARDHPNLYCKLSGMVTEAAQGWTPEALTPYMEEVVEAFGPERILYGSDWPVCLLNAKDYRVVHDLVNTFVGRFGPTAQADIFGGNARRFYRLPSL